MKKKFLSIILSTAILQSCITPIMAKDVITLSGGTVYTTAGEQFTLPFTAENADSITSFTLELTYDEQYVQPVKNSLKNKGFSAVNAIEYNNKIIISADNVDTKQHGTELFSYDFTSSEGLTNEINTAVSINLMSVTGEAVTDITLSNASININKTKPQTLPVPVLETTPAPIPETTPSPEVTPVPPPKQEQEVSLSQIPDKVYGDAPFKLEASSQTGAVHYSSSDGNVATVSDDGTVTITGAGVCTISAYVEETEQYKLTEVKTNLTVNKKLLTVYPNDLTITYGEELPQNLIAYDGFINEADADALSKQVIVSGLPQTIEPGTYVLTLSGIDSDDYKVSYIPGTLTILPKAISINSLSVYPKLADGTRLAVINPLEVVLSDINVGDDVSIDLGSATAEFAQAESGDNIPVVIKNLSLCGIDADKYTLTSTEYNTTEDIKSEFTAADAAALIPAAQTTAKDVHTLAMPYVGSGFEVAIASTENAEIVSASGEIGFFETEQTTNVMYSISKGNDFATAISSITVPASSRVSVSQDADSTVAITGTGTYFKGQEITLTLPRGYKAIEWFIDGQSVGGRATSSRTIIAEKDTTVSVNAVFHLGGSLKPNIVKKISSSVPSSKKVVAGTLIELRTETEGAIIYYTTDESIPNSNSIKYTGPIEISEDITIKAIGIKPKTNNSVVSTFKYEVRQAQKELKTNASSIRYMASYKDNTFRPDQVATRYEVLCALDLLMDIEEFDSYNVFTDVDEEYADVVAKFANVGIISGYGNGTFGGNRSITRAEFITILTKALDYDKGISYNYGFIDIRNHWAKDIINSFAKSGYVSGYPDGSFRPDNKVTRAEVVSVINRMVGTREVTASQRYIDLSPSHWAYRQIMAVVF